MDLLYEEVIYTVVNRVGVPSPEYVTNEGDLYRYLQKVFEVKPELHEVVLQRVQESKRASFSLKISVVEGKDLLAKDPNGYSDPYCMLGIVPGQAPREVEEKRERKFSFRKRKEKLEKHASVKEGLAAKCIQVTEVKHETLNPVWNEHFVFEIDDVLSDFLHLDIWDHDDDVSVAEACKKLNEVSGLKGMGRYFKQIAKSVRTNGTSASGAEENMDDFLGCVNIPVNEIPVGGYDRWFKLEPRSSASKVQGECHLILKLFTTQRDTALSRRDSQVRIHEKLLSQILLYEHQQVQVNILFVFSFLLGDGAKIDDLCCTETYNWGGRLSKQAWTVLSHHAVQTNLSPLQQAIIRWRCYSSHHRGERMCYSFLLGLLRTIEEEWDASSLEEELKNSLADSFNLHIEHCLSLLRRLRQVFPCSSPIAITRCSFMLSGLGFLQAMQAFRASCPQYRELSQDVATVIKKSTMEWYGITITRHKKDEAVLEQQLKHLVLVVDAVCADLQRELNIYNKLFCSSLKVDLFSISYQQLEKLVASDARAAMDKVCVALEQEGGAMSQAMGDTLFELYMSLKTLGHFRDFLPESNVKMLALTGYHEWFKASVHKWFQMVNEISCDRIRKAVKEDQLKPVSGVSKHSASAAQVTSCFSQVWDFWVQLAWPETAGACTFLTRLVEDLSSAAVLYCELIKRKMDNSQQDTKTLTGQLCVALNNVEHVRAFLGNLPRGLGLQGAERAAEERSGAEGAEQGAQAWSSQLWCVDAELHKQLKNMIGQLTDKMLLGLNKYIRHISLSPDSINNDDAVSPLMKYLDDTLVILSESLVKDNLARVLRSLWSLILRIIFDTVAENRDVSVEFYGRFHFTLEALVEFFHAEGEGLTLEDLRNEDHRALERELRLNRCSSSELIEQYFVEKIAQQRMLKHSKFGRMSVRCYYEALEQRLTVEVLHASDLIALDANGLSDPFVIVELCPHHVFPAAKSQRTQVKPKTLHPVFDETFYFRVTPEQHKHRAACVLFTVMDYDWLSTNDFAGEATASLGDFAVPDRAGAHGGGRAVQPLLLHLTRPKPSEKPIMKMLESRTTDREAQEFVRKMKDLEKSMGDEECLLFLLLLLFPLTLVSFPFLLPTAHIRLRVASLFLAVALLAFFFLSGPDRTPHTKLTSRPPH
ncbi:BAI1-associated protein 3-like, partial [Scleropages formosus]